ncbi:MAG: DsrE family protein [Sphingobacteriales bacterium]|nr:DsrE family protein [Sphingobacteriales bacterium]MBI3719938.1 DsrE family protein [Sphingobacteriales bacterium]
MRKILALLTCMLCYSIAFSQASKTDNVINVLKQQKDSTLKALFKADSAKTEKEFGDKIRWEKLKAQATYPVINAGEFSGVLPVKDPTEIPDPDQDYKLLFELVNNNPDSIIKENNEGLVEVVRVINLHVVSGIPLKRIIPVIVVHGGALNAFATNAYYNKKFKCDNPNIKLIGELEKLGTKIIACGQAMAFKNIQKEDLLPTIKVSVTAQTVLTNYQLKGYVWMSK